MLKVKIFVGISLLLFFVTVVSLFTAAIINYQTEKAAKVLQTQPGVVNRLANLDQGGGENSQTVGGTDLTLDEVARHNLESDCWLVIVNKVYDVTGYLVSHPGGKPIIVKYCGKDGTIAFASKDKTKAVDHSKMAHDLLNQYYVGDLGQRLSSAPVNSVFPTPSGSGKTGLVPTFKPSATLGPGQTGNLPANTGLTLTTGEVASHNTLQNCWLIISGKVYDVTTYISQHPGGAQMILNSCGKDGTSAYGNKGGTGGSHSSYASNLLNNYLIGTIGSTVVVNPTAVLTGIPTARPSSIPPTLVPGAPQPTNVPNPTSPPGVGLTAGEVASHNTLQNCWLIISGKVYNVTSYISQHPGGAQMIVNQCGKDGTTAFATKGGSGGNHSNNAYSLLNNYLIGTLGTTVPTNPTATPIPGVNPTATGAPGVPTNTQIPGSCINMPSAVCSKYPGATRKTGEYDGSRWEGEANTPSNGCRHIKTNNNVISSDSGC